MDTVTQYFHRAFPIKKVYVNELNRNRWITQGIKIYTKRMRFLKRMNKIQILHGSHKTISTDIK